MPYPQHVADDLRLLDGPIHESNWPQVACPVCGTGVLVSLADSLVLHESAESHRSLDHEAWEPDWTYGVFSGSLRCINPRCTEPVVVSGRYRVEDDYEPDGRPTYATYFYLEFATPALKILTPPTGTPDVVVTAIERASAVLWVDPSAAANRLRTAIEMLLTAMDVQELNLKGGRLTTHARIELFQAINQDAGNALMAVKWIGNAGSHVGSLTVTDVLDGAEMLDLALRLLYDRRDEELQKRIDEVNTHKGLPPKSQS